MSEPEEVGMALAPRPALIVVRKARLRIAWWWGLFNGILVSLMAALTAGVIFLFLTWYSGTPLPGGYFVRLVNAIEAVDAQEWFIVGMVYAAGLYFSARQLWFASRLARKSLDQ